MRVYMITPTFKSEGNLNSSLSPSPLSSRLLFLEGLGEVMHF